MIDTPCQVSTEAGNVAGTITDQCTVVYPTGEHRRGWIVALDCGWRVWAADAEVFPLADVEPARVALGGRC